eukprot:2317134-Prymnesium_polylepis.1
MGGAEIFSQQSSSASHIVIRTQTESMTMCSTGLTYLRQRNLQVPCSRRPTLLLGVRLSSVSTCTLTSFLCALDSSDPIACTHDSSDSDRHGSGWQLDSWFPFPDCGTAYSALPPGLTEGVDALDFAGARA